MDRFICGWSVWFRVTIRIYVHVNSWWLRLILVGRYRSRFENSISAIVLLLGGLHFWSIVSIMIPCAWYSVIKCFVFENIVMFNSEWKIFTLIVKQ